MLQGTRKIVDRTFSAVAVGSILLLAATLLVFLAPIVVRGSAAFVFQGTIEYRRLMFEKVGRGRRDAIALETAAAMAARQPVYAMIAAFHKELHEGGFAKRRKYAAPLKELEDALQALLGPPPDKASDAPMLRARYGQTRWDRALVKAQVVLSREEWDFSHAKEMGRKVVVARAADFQGTAIAPLFPYVESHLSEMLLPQWTFYWQFLFDNSFDAHMFGGIWPELLGTIYLTLGAMTFAIPLGVVSAIYLTEYSVEGRLVRILRTFVNTLAGVPSIVFGLFGLAFFINTIHVSGSKSVLAGSMTLALLVLPVVVRAAEEAIQAVPPAYKEAALSLGAGKWHAVVTVTLPAALPGILTGIVISMGRAAGETAPIIFTAAVSVGRALRPSEIFSQPTPALPWNIYNISTEHAAVDEIRHVQFGMVLTLVMVVLLLNLAAIIMRARISRKLRG
jgi:phosphate transport system permease protein